MSVFIVGVVAVVVVGGGVGTTVLDRFDRSMKVKMVCGHLEW